jgi:23S rRNA pseudouridine1911/1915/1917 synthase
LKNYSIIFEDEHLVVANKLTAIAVQAEKSGDPNFQDMLKADISVRDGGKPLEFLEAVHRLDRRSTGAVLFAKSKSVAGLLSEDLRENNVKKTYLAVVDRAPDPPTGRLEQRIAWDPRNRKAHIIQTVEDESLSKKNRMEIKSAILSYAVKSASERYTLLSITLETGRSHQIRAQLASIGLPIRGDLKYGARRSTKNGLIMLHDYRLEFVHPRTGVSLSLVAPPPDSDPLWGAFDLSE